jgi:hypothetical protein
MTKNEEAGKGAKRRSRNEPGILLQGNEAVVEGALAAGRTGWEGL